MSKLYRAAVAPFRAAIIASGARADGPDIFAQRLLDSWKGEDPGMRMVAEVIASAFASGFSWGGDDAGKRVYCASPEPNHERLRGVLESQSYHGRRALRARSRSETAAGPA